MAWTHLQSQPVIATPLHSNPVLSVQVQPHVLPLQMGAEQQASSSNEDNDSDNWEDESSR